MGKPATKKPTQEATKVGKNKQDKLLEKKPAQNGKAKVAKKAAAVVEKVVVAKPVVEKKVAAPTQKAAEKKKLENGAATKGKKAEQPKAVAAKNVKNSEVKKKGGDKKKKEFVRDPEIAAAKKANKKARKQKHKEVVSKIPQLDATEEKVTAPFPEDLFSTTFSKANITKVVKNTREAAKKLATEKKTLFDEDVKYMVNITCFKIPRVPRRNARLELVHSLTGSDDDVCLFTPDLERGRKTEYEPTVQHYEELLRKEGITSIKTVMPFTQLRNEFEEFEAKRKLLNTYDKFLADKRVIRHTNRQLGKIFSKKCKDAMACDLLSKNLKENLDKALRKVVYKKVNNGILTSIPVGTHKMSVSDIGDNILSVVKSLGEFYPGGADNVKNIYVRTADTSGVSLPLFISLNEPPKSVPVETGPKQKLIAKQQEKAELLLKKFELKKNATIVKKQPVLPAKKAAAVEAEDDDEDEDEDDTTSEGNDTMNTTATLGDSDDDDDSEDNEDDDDDDDDSEDDASSVEEKVVPVKKPAAKKANQKPAQKQIQPQQNGKAAQNGKAQKRALPVPAKSNNKKSKK